MTTAVLARFLGLVLTAALGVGVAGCGDGSAPAMPTGPPMPFAIQVSNEQPHVKPNESRQIVFQLFDAAGQPLPGRTMQLLIVDGMKARGATLSIDRGITGAMGEVAVQIIGGQPTEFLLRASAQGAPDRELTVHVTAQDSGPIAVAPEVTAGPLGPNVARIRIAVFPNMGCASVPRGMPLSAEAQPRETTPGKPVVFGSLSAAGGHAIYGQGVDATDVLLVEGCVDLSGKSILAENIIRVVLPLTALEPAPFGRFAALSQLRFATEPAPLRAVRSAWRELDACELDPGRLWLDCTVDALGPAQANDPTDPLDCKPSAADEAVFDGRLSARRGLPVLTSKEGRCRQDFDGAGHGSLEKQITQMFSNTEAARIAAQVKLIAADAGKLLEFVRVRSTMAVAATSQPGRVQLDHHLGALEFTIGADPVVIELPKLGAPMTHARFIPGNATRTDLTIDRHGFTLRLGVATRAAFVEGALARRRFPADPVKFVAGVFAAASYMDRGVTHRGCPALAALVCPLVGAPDGCLGTACEQGVAALGHRLTAVFDELDGADLDFFLQGSAPLLDVDGDGRAEGIGHLARGPGVWKSVVRLGSEQFPLSGFFAAERLTP